MGQCFVFLIFAACLSLQIQPLLSKRPGSWAHRYSDDECDLPTISKGRARWLRRPIARFVCMSSYKLVGMKYITCRDGEWEEPLPVCARSGCDIPVVPHSFTLRRYGNALLEFFCMPEHKMVGGPVIYCDGTQWNATAPSCVSITSPPVLSCNFDSDMCGWQQDDSSDFDWTRINRKTPSSMYQTGPSKDHTTGTGFYMYIESTGQPENKTALLISPVYDDKLSHDGCFSFFYHMYGRYIGGLRVYQRPMSVPLEDLRDDDLLFEKWYNQGDQWLESVSKLKNTSEFFQIVIEGVRGQSYTSDIAIDDVAILQGDNCSRVVAVATTTPQPLESCVDRCNQAPEANSSDCSCSWDCFLEGTCCQDILFVCTDAFEKTTTEQPPQTERLVSHNNTTMEARPTVPPATTRPTPKTTPVTTTKTTISSVSSTTTRKPTSRQAIVFKSTTAVFNATGVLKKDTTTTGKPATAATKVPTSTTKRSYIPKTFGQSNDSRRFGDSGKPRARVMETKSSTSGKATAITFAVLLCCLAVGCAAIAARTARGRVALARLRGRTTSSTEVRYLTADTDD